jgi:uncharacterized protein YjbI with pentapeptide repeats
MIRPILLLTGLMLALSGEALGDCSDSPRPGVDWSGCIVSAATFRGVDLSGANLRDILIVGSKILDSDFSAADLTDARISTSDLSGSNFTEATLDRVHFTTVNLSGTLFKNAKIDLGTATNVNLTDANFQGARITASWVEFRQFCRTVMPDGSINNSACD